MSISKTSSIADILKKKTSLSSNPDIALKYLKKFKLKARNVRALYGELMALCSGLRHITHEIESIIDNFFAVEAAIFEIENHIKKSDFKNLPLIAAEKNKYAPRLHFILSGLLKENSQIIDREILESFLVSYQKHSPLSIRELYAIPLLLQVVLVEHFGKLIEQSIKFLREYREADITYQNIKDQVNKASFSEFSKITSDLGSKYPLIPLSFGLHLYQKLSQEGSVMRPVIKWIKLNLDKQGINLKNLGEIESRLKSEDFNTISHIIESLHWIAQTRWDDIVQEINVVDTILSRDPAGIYSKMDIESAMEYRKAIVRIAERAAIHEAEVAKIAVRLASSNDASLSMAKKHVGYYLVDKGIIELEKKIGYRLSWKDVLYRFIVKNNQEFYFSSAFGINIVLTLGLGFIFWNYNASLLSASLFMVVVFLLNTEITLNILNVIITRFLPVRKLPKLDLLSVVSEKQRTFVVVPSMFHGVETVHNLIRKLEVCYLGNPQENILYALLLDFKDASSETMPEDDALIKAAEEGVDNLNARYSQNGQKFFILYRKRIWNEKEGAYMGWERKRGKLREFNMLLRGARETSYMNGDVLRNIGHISYVITLDEDTELPKDAASGLIGTIYHPLNRPVLSLSGDRVERGYGIIQPRIGIRLALASKSIFSRLFSSVSGIDSYSSAVSDVYYDLFDNSLFFGKGIYDIDAVEKVMDGKIPDNLILSHDLLEGLYTRVGFASTIVLFDGFPNFYHEFMIRLDRWIRGDWQIIGWIKRKYHPKGAREPTLHFSFIDRWKIIDNLRRSLIPVFSIMIIAYGIFSAMPLGQISIYAVFVFGAPFLAALASDLFSLKKVPFSVRFYDTLRQIKLTFLHIILRAAIILHQAIVSITAIFRAIINLVIKKNLLRWHSFSDVSKKLSGKLLGYYQTMWTTQFVSIFLAILAYFFAPINNFLYFWLIFWLLSPLVGYFISLPRNKKKILNPKDTRMLRSIAYRTSHFFTDFSHKENNWLAQDNYQEYPKIIGISHPATSPTNIGMLFTSLFSSYEFGFIPLDHYIDKTRRAFASVSKLDRFKGHLYNWYDITKLQSLHPKYVSSIDSANFVVALITVRQGLKSIAQKPLVSSSVIRGVEDALYVLDEEVERVMNRNSFSKISRKILRAIRLKVKVVYKMVNTFNEPETISEAYLFLSKVYEHIGRIEKSITSLKAHTHSSELSFLFAYGERLMNLVETHLRFIRYIFPHSTPLDTAIRSYVFRDIYLFAVYKDFIKCIQKIPTFYELATSYLDQAESLNFRKAIISSHLAPDTKKYILSWYDITVADIRRAQSRAREFLSDIEYCENECARFIDEPDFTFFYNKERGLFHIGYNAAFGKIDSATYNFLASESNSISFVSILKNQISSKNWFYLGRKFIRSGQGIALVSWGGSLFEYLTPLLFFKTHPESLLGKTALTAIRTHQSDARREGTPWGMGESAYYAFDSVKHYQYQVFGSAKLGLKRGLSDHHVIAPYTSILALSVALRKAVDNIKNLISLGAKGNYGLYDAIDYMDERRVRISEPLPIKIYYAHHQGFVMLGLHNILLKNTIQEYFHNDPRVEALEILLEEKMPTSIDARFLSKPVRMSLAVASTSRDTGFESKRYIPAKIRIPRYALISNGSYSIGISNSGAGWSNYKGVSLTRSRHDGIIEEYGSYIFVKDEKTGMVWSPTIHPLSREAQKQKIIFFENKAEFFSSMGNIASRLEVTVDPQNPVEVRQLTMTNNGSERVKLQVASYGEVSLALNLQDVQHPKYHKLLVASEFLEEYDTLIYSRPHPEDRLKKIYFSHTLVQGVFEKAPIFPCVEREKFIGQYGSLSEPIIFNSNITDSGVKEYSLDPIFSLRHTIDLKAGESVHFSFVNCASESREELIRLIKQYKKPRMLANLFARAEKESAMTTKKLNITQEMAVVYQELASVVLGGKMQTTVSHAPETRLPYIHFLWHHGISGNNPLVMIAIKDTEDLQMIQYALSCHAYWKHKGLNIDIVIFNQEPASYIKFLDDEIDFLIRQKRIAEADGKKSAVYHVKSDLMTNEERKALLFAAKVIIDSKTGSFKKQVSNFLFSKNLKFPEKLSALARHSKISPKTALRGALPKNLLFTNSFGGFDEINSEYAMHISSNNMPPAPWTNIISNENFGTIITEAGSANTWAVDSYDNRITSWQNDSLVFKSPEIVYIRDKETGEIWNPTPFPVPTDEPFIVRHGKGYTIFEHNHSGIEHSFEIFVPRSEKIKISRLKIKNKTKIKRNLSVTSYLETVMGISIDPSNSRDFLQFSKNRATGALLIRNMFRNNFHNSIAFADINGGSYKVSTNREEFLGRYGSYSSPEALSRVSLSDEITHGSEGCAVLESVIKLDPDEEKEIIIILGETESESEVERMIIKYRSIKNVKAEREKIRSFWSSVSSKIQIESPDKKLDIMFNQNLLYQVLSSRLMAKTGFDQPGGAYGFRDQLQDIISLVWSNPGRVRSFILKAAMHQFKEGDAMNWWHDHNNFGIRNVLSDHQLWLVYAITEYISITGDKDILDELIPYLEGHDVNFTYQREWAGIPDLSNEKDTLYEHSIRALEKSLVFGKHNLPLIGMSDWNDGLSRVGILGKGESVWLGWFLIYLLEKIIPYVEERNDTLRLSRYKLAIDNLVKALDKNAWDGRWYKRAFLDNGVALGSHKLKEFKIDSLSQSWSVLSKKGNPEKVSKAIHSGLSYLYNGKSMKIIAPPLKMSLFDPGYIKDYPPGVRENGSQYNHAALFMAQALFILGESDTAKKIIDLVNPITHSDSHKKALVYRAQPNVVASDIYTNPSFEGRGGWTWYTGSAATMYKTIIQFMFGFNKKGDSLSFSPSLPSDWTSCAITYHYGNSLYHINIEKPAGIHNTVMEVYENNVKIKDKTIKLVDDSQEHFIKVVLS